MIAVTTNRTALLYTISGSQGSEWKQANVNVGQHGNYYLALRANTDVGSPSGYMAVDDTSLSGYEK